MRSYLLAGLSGAVLCCSASFASEGKQAEAMRIMVSLNQRVEAMGYEAALATAPLDLAQLQQQQQGPQQGQDPRRPGGGIRISLDCWGLPGVCAPNPVPPNYEIRDDAIQILTNEVLYQTLRYFGVRFTFEKKNVEGVSQWTFTVINAIPGENFQDLDTPLVLGAVTQFRRYVIGLLCNSPSPSHVLALLNRGDLGVRFRWDMAWALLGNELPPTLNRYMRFSEQWKRFAAALDALQNGTSINIFNPGGALGGTVDPGLGGSGGSAARAGAIAREAIGIIELVGNIASTIIDLYCRIDLTVDQRRQADEQQVVLKLLQLKKDLYHRFNELRPALDEMGRQGTRALGRPISFYPPGNFPRVR